MSCVKIDTSSDTSCTLGQTNGRRKAAGGGRKINSKMVEPKRSPVAVGQQPVIGGSEEEEELGCVGYIIHFMTNNYRRIRKNLLIMKLIGNCRRQPVKA